MSRSKVGDLRVVVTGGAGFIGSALVRSLVRDYGTEVLTLDKLTYAGRLDNLEGVLTSSRHHFSRVDICDLAVLRRAVLDFHPDAIVHLAAESHVDRSIDGPADFVATNVLGTFNVLEVARELHERSKSLKVVHVSTDEVFGALGATGAFTEATPYRPRSPYAASKASSDHLARAWFETYGLPVMVTNCSNNYGPHQFPEKLIPLVVQRARNRQPVPIYGDGLQVRDWLHVQDHVDALVRVVEAGCPGETYNIGAACERTNIEVVNAILQAVAELTGCAIDELTSLLEHVRDRPGHDRRYAIDASKIRAELGWVPRIRFEPGIRDTVAWYLANEEWCRRASERYAGERLGLGSSVERVA